MFSISYSTRVVLIIMALIVLMVMPALADAPPKPQHPSAPPTVAMPIAGKPIAPAKATPAQPTAASAIPCPPCEFCGMYPPNPYGPRVAAPQLQGSGAPINYAPKYVPQGTAYGALPYGAQHANPNRYISNLPDPAGHNPSLGEVWHKHGGARLQYDALRGPIQMNTNGRPVKDPAMVHLPPLYPQYTKKAVRKKAVKPQAPPPHALKPAPKANASTLHSYKPVPKPTAPLQSTPKSAEKTVPAPTEQTIVKSSPPVQRPAVNTMNGTGISRPASPITQSPYDGPARL